MKQGRTIFSSLLLLGTGILLYLGKSSLSQETITQWSTAMLTRQLGSIAVLAPQATEVSTSSPMPSIAEAVPVTTVAEAWDELVRQTEPPSTSSTPVSLNEETFELRNETSYAVDLTRLPSLPTFTIPENGDPVVLIVHTHGSESYAEASLNGYRSQDESQSVIAVGEAIGAALEQHGYSVYHDKTICDQPDFNRAYSQSRKVIENALAQYPEIFLVLDIHRDAVEDSDGNQLRMACTIDGQSASQLMLVVGTDAGGLEHPTWQNNLSLGAVLQMRLDGAYPELMRPLNLRRERFNQDLAPLSLLVEVGASGNTLAEAKLSAQLFGQMLAEVLDDCKSS